MFSSSTTLVNKFNTFESFLNSTKSATVNRIKPQDRPENYTPLELKHDELHTGSTLKCKIQNALNIPDYAYRGIKGDPDFNFFEYMQVCKIPYYVGGLGLIAVAMAGRNNGNPSAAIGNKVLTKKIALGVLFYYIAKNLARKAIDIPVRLFRGIDLNMQYRNAIDLSKGNPFNLPNDQRTCYEPVFSSSEFTRYDLLYKHGESENSHKFFNKLARKFGAKGKLNDSDSAVMEKIKKLIIMSDSWKYFLAAPFVTLALGLAQEDAMAKMSFSGLFNYCKDLIEICKKPSFKELGKKLKDNLLVKGFADFWRGYSIPVNLQGNKNSIQQIAHNTSFFKKSVGKFAIISSVVLPIIANIMILKKTSLANECKDCPGGNN